MWSRCLSGWLVAGCFLVPLPLYGQTVERHESEEVTPLPPEGPVPAQRADLDRVAKQIIAATNKFRAAQGRHELKVNADLSRAARYFADFMARTDKYGHTADGRQPSQRMTKYGYRYCLVAENIAWEYDSEGFTTDSLARHLVSGWKHSPPHRRNMLDPDLEDIGVAVAFSTRTGRYYAVQDFGRPRSAAITFKITNDADTRVRYSVNGRSFSLPPRYTRTHMTCRAPDLEFEGVSISGGGEALHPGKGSEYAVRRDDEGRLTVTKR